MKKTIECFVPALALEHPQNRSDYSITDKIRAAIRRYEQTDDFFGDSYSGSMLPFIAIEKVQFKPIEMGYLVMAKFL